MELALGPHHPTDAVAHAAERLALEWRPRTSGGTVGDRLGRTQGASIEFADRRAYTAGDDVRHIDWRAFARSDQLLVRTYREEIAPRLDILLDASSSLAVEVDKARGALDVAALWLRLGRAAGFATRLWSMGEPWRAVASEELTREGWRFDGRAPLEQSLDRASSLAAGGMRVVVSDWMTPAPARQLMRRAFGGAAAGMAIATWHTSEVEPSHRGPTRLVDVETGAGRDVVLDPARRARYLTRFARWRDELAAEARRLGVLFVPWTVPADLEQACRLHLGPLGLVAAS